MRVTVPVVLVTIPDQAYSAMCCWGRLAAALLLTTLAIAPAASLPPEVDQQDVDWVVGLRR